MYHPGSGMTVSPRKWCVTQEVWAPDHLYNVQHTCTCWNAIEGTFLNSYKYIHCNSALGAVPLGITIHVHLHVTAS